MKTYTPDELKAVLAKHLAWLKNQPDGERADLSSADLSYADLSYADLSSADLSYADLRYADLSSADLSYADLRYADLSSADLSSANLISAGYSSRGYHFLGINEKETGFRVKAGCRNYNVAEAKSHWVNYPEELARVALLETLAIARGWIVPAPVVSPVVATKKARTPKTTTASAHAS